MGPRTDVCFRVGKSGWKTLSQVGSAASKGHAVPNQYTSTSPFSVVYVKYGCNLPQPRSILVAAILSTRARRRTGVEHTVLVNMARPAGSRLAYTCMLAVLHDACVLRVLVAAWPVASGLGSQGEPCASQGAQPARATPCSDSTTSVDSPYCRCTSSQQHSHTVQHRAS
jgi:hypothetical protein